MTPSEYKKLNCTPTDPKSLQVRMKEGILQIAPDEENWCPFMFSGYGEEQARELTAWHIDSGNFYANPHVSLEDREDLWGRRKEEYETKWNESIFGKNENKGMG